MTESRGFLEVNPGDDAATIARLNQMIAVIQQGRALGFECDEMVETFMRETRRAMRRGLLAGGKEIMEKHGDPFYEQDEGNDGVMAES